MAEVKSKYTTVNLAYKLCQPSNVQDNKTPIIFSHGMSGNKEYWYDLPQIVAEKTKRKVYNVDARHHGESERQGPFHLDVNADDLVHFMDTHKIEKAILVGHSMGGITSYKVALSHPSRVEKICAVDIASTNKMDFEYFQTSFARRFEVMKAACGAASQAETDEEAEKLYFQYCQENGCEDMKKTMHADHSFGRYRVESLRRDQSGQYRYPFNIDALIEGQRAGPLWSDFAGRYEGPVLVVVGGKSEIPVQEFESEIKSFFPKARFELIEDASHYIPIEGAREFEEILLKFLLED